MMEDDHLVKEQRHTSTTFEKALNFNVIKQYTNKETDMSTQWLQ